jgi:hypothetical protein
VSGVTHNKENISAAEGDISVGVKCEGRKVEWVSSVGWKPPRVTPSLYPYVAAKTNLQSNYIFVTEETSLQAILSIRYTISMHLVVDLRPAALTTTKK